MQEYTPKIREIAKRLFEEKKIDVFIGYEKGTNPFFPRPTIISSHDEVDKLIWNSNCGLNLCNYLTGRKERIGIIANGCTSRNIVTHILEKQITREQLYIVGIPCTGIIDHRMIQAAVDEEEILEIEEEIENFKVIGNGFEKSFKKEDFLQDNCLTCTHPNPVIYDEILGDPVKERSDRPSYEDLEEVENMPIEKRRFHIQKLIQRCIRCYACRNVCPLCYCPTCFVDERIPWLGKSIDPTDTLTFHILRAFHCAGRCTDCGACERVCPMAIPVRIFTKKLNKDAWEIFSWEAGLSLEQKPLLTAYKKDDYDDFI